MSDDGALFKRMISSKFRDCVLLGTTKDDGRQRVMQAYMIDNREDIIGINDGVDCWIASPLTSLPELKLVTRIKEAIANPKPVIRTRATINQPIPRRKIIQ